MKISETWLREWIDLTQEIETNELVRQLTMLGLEIEGVDKVAPEFIGVVVGEVLEVLDHPNAERLHICKVQVEANNETAQPLSIICGAQNVRQGLKVAVALIGASLPGDFKIKKAKLRGVESFGMLCSAKELGLVEVSSGILELPDDAPIGKDFRDYFALDDNVIDIKVTPNRGDCLSVLGVARELGAVNRLPINKPQVLEAIDFNSDVGALSQKSAGSGIFAVEVLSQARKACPHYAGCIINGIDNTAITPLWMQERLRRSGLRSIHPVVDVTNYVMLELGQPLHGFDLAKLTAAINVRFAKEGEQLTLLDGRIEKLNPDDLVIADKAKVLALAGVMGGEYSGVTTDTTEVFLESAYFSAKTIRSATKRHGLTTDSSYRFERGVDPSLQVAALNRAVQLIMEIAGGQMQPVIEVVSAVDLPKQPQIKFNRDRIKQVIGIEFKDYELLTTLQHLNMQVIFEAEDLIVVPPTYRFDINIAEDVLEELIRIYGYNNLPAEKIKGELLPPRQDECCDPAELQRRLSDVLVVRGYHEVITYSFVDDKLQKLLYPDRSALLLANPIAQNMQAMRLGLLPGLFSALLSNNARHRERVRLFEAGLCFRNDPETKVLSQEPFFAAVAMGQAYPEQWGLKNKAEDFYDIKSDIESLLQNLGCLEQVKFVVAANPVFHPKRCAEIYLNNKIIGYIGELHPKVNLALKLAQKVYAVEINLSLLNSKLSREWQKVSKFPCIQRDIALVVDNSISWEQIKEKIVAQSSEILQYIQVFDVYSGSDLGSGEKSIGIRLIFQDTERTLSDKEIEQLMDDILLKLKESFNARLRG